MIFSAVIMMEGGTEFDLTVLDGPNERINSNNGQRSRTTSENQPSER